MYLSNLFRLICLLCLSTATIAFSSTSNTVVNLNPKEELPLWNIKPLDIVPIIQDHELQRAADRQGITWITGLYQDALLRKEVIVRLNSGRIVHYDFFISRSDTLRPIPKETRTRRIDFLNRSPT